MPNAIRHSPLALAVLVALAGCQKQQPTSETAAPATPAAATEQSAQPHPTPATAASDVDLSGIARAEGGKTVAEIFAEKDALAGTSVSVRGKVVKTNAAIMDTNWLHLRDGSGDEGTNDLTVTTSGELPNVGDTVLVTGTAALDQDYGMGYRYPVILQNAEVIIELPGS